MSNQEPPMPPSGPTTTDRLKQAVQLERVNSSVPVEVGSTAAAAQVKALVEARFVMALQRPRNWQQVRQDLIDACSEPAFALEPVKGKGNSALYRKPVGRDQDGNQNYAEGLGIRFAEVAERCMGNIMSDSIVLQDDDTLLVKYCFVLDLETNNSWADTVRVAKTVERTKPRDGEAVLSSRQNSRGQLVYTIAATDDAVAMKDANLTSKKMRTLILRMVPGDLQAKCIQVIKEVRSAEIAKSPKEYLNQVVDGMRKLNITVAMVEEYLEHPIAQCSPAEIENLQMLWVSVRDGDITWAEILADKDEARKLRREATPATPDKGVEAIKEKLQEQAPPAQATVPAQPAPVAQPAQPAAPVAPPVVAQPPVAPVQPAPAPVAPAQPAPVAPEQPVAPPVVAPVAAVPAEPTPAPVVAPVTPVEPVQAPAANQPAWTAPAQPAPVAQPAPEPVATPAPAAPAVETKPEIPGKILKGVWFPLQMEAVTQEELATPDQLARAGAALQKISETQGKNFKLDSTVKSWFQTDITKVSQMGIDSIIKVLEEW